jgi:class 3 adenylate cyclase
MPAPKSRYTLTFEDPQLEANYWAAFFDRHEAYARAVYLFSMVILVAYGLYERVLFPDRYQLFWFIRYVFVVPMALTAAPLLWWRPLRTFTRRRLQEVVTACVTAVLLGLAVITYVTLDVRENFEILYFGLGFSITAIFPYLVLRLRFIFASFLGWSITFGATVVVLSNGGFSLGFTAVFVQMVTINLLGMIGAYLLESYDRDNYVAQQELADARGRAEALLLNVLPEPIAERLKSGEQPIADHFEDVAVVFTDIAGFTPMSAELPPAEVVQLLNEVFTAFDRMADAEGVEKIKTIGDAYMVAAGIPTPRADAVDAAARLALGMRRWVRERHRGALRVRIGIHVGPVIAGVIGQRKFIYDLWGDTVNVAARMESHGEAGASQLTQAARARLSEAFEVAQREEIVVKGRGPMTTWWLVDGPCTEP